MILGGGQLRRVKLSSVVLGWRRTEASEGSLAVSAAVTEERAVAECGDAR